MTRSIIRNRLFSLSGVLVIAFASLAGAETIKVFPDCIAKIGGYDEVQRIFGGCVNGSTRDEGIAEIRALHLNSARAYFWGPRPAFKTPWYVTQYGGTSVSKEKAFLLWDKFYAQDFSQLMAAWWKNGYPQADQLYQAELFRKWALTRGIVLHTELDGSADRHPDAVNAYYQAYLDTIHRNAPWMHVEFVQFQNEPNYSHWSGQFATRKEAVKSFIRSFNRLDAYFEQHIDSTRLLGPCLSSDTFFSWSGWRDWTLPFLKDTRQVDYFNYHIYGKGAGEHLAWLGMLQAASESLRGVRPQGVITEASLTAGYEPARESFRWEAEQLFMGLANPDKLALRTYFLLAYPKKRPGTLPEEVAKNILDQRDEKLQPSAIYWIYRVLAETRGKMRWVQPPKNSELKVCATSPRPDQLVLSVFNSAAKPATFMASPGTDPKIAVRKIVQRSAHMEEDEAVYAETEFPAGDSSVSVTVPAGGVSSIRWEFDKPLPAPSSTLEQKEYFSHETGLKINAERKISIEVEEPPAEDSVAFLRIGITTDDTLFARELSFQFNGQEQKIVWSELPRFVQLGGHAANTWCVDLPLKASAVKKHNEIQFSKPDASYKLMFASVVSQRFPTAKAAKEWLSEWREKNRASIRVGLRAPGRLIAGEQVPIELTLRNVSGNPAACQVVWNLPDGVSLEGMSPTGEVNLAAGEERTFKEKLKVGSIRIIQAALLKVNVNIQGRESQSLTQNTCLYPYLAAGFFSSPPDLNGNDAEWNAMPEIQGQPGGLATDLRLGWDKTHLYAFVKVRGDFRPVPSDTLETFWMKDAVEIFLDLGNEKKPSFDRNDFQLFVCPQGVKTSDPVGGMVAREIRDDSVAFLGARTDLGILVSRTNLQEGGYSLKCAIPWKSLDPQFTARSGKTIGFDMAIDHNRNGSSIVGGKGKEHQRPDRWGILHLLP